MMINTPVVDENPVSCSNTNSYHDVEQTIVFSTDGPAVLPLLRVCIATLATKTRRTVYINSLKTYMSLIHKLTFCGCAILSCCVVFASARFCRREEKINIGGLTSTWRAGGRLTVFIFTRRFCTSECRSLISACIISTSCL